MTTTIIASLLSFIAGAVIALRYGVSITGMIKADLALLHHHVTEEVSKVTAKVDSVVSEANADAVKVEAKVAAVDAAIKG
jgi:hypothetical protein